MSTCIPTAAITSVAAPEPTTSSSALPSLFLRPPRHPNSNLVPFSKRTHFALTCKVTTKAQSNNVGMDGSSSGAAPQSKSEAPVQEIKNGKPSSESVTDSLATEESISKFIAQVSGLVRLVDSRDIVELQLKQHDCELLIRKKEAVAQLSPAPVIMMQSPSQSAVPQTTIPSSAPVAAPAASPPPSPSVPKPAKSSAPPLKSPMAGTFYRSPAPNAAPFVKVGDKVQKGQVLCIIEAMKLMNEIEADQAGTVVEILAEDGKPVSVDTPLFAIQP